MTISRDQISLRNALRKVKAVQVRCTVVLANGEEKSTHATIGYNKIGELSGNGLTSKALYDLAKKGFCESVENGVTFKYQILLPESAEQQAYVPSAEAVAAAESLETIDATGVPNNDETKTTV